MKPNDLIWRAGFADWRAAEDVFPQEMAGGKATSAASAQPQPPSQHTAEPARASGYAHVDQSVASSPTRPGRALATDTDRYAYQTNDLDTRYEQRPSRRGPVVFAILALAILGGGGYYAYENRDRLMTMAAQFAATSKSKKSESTSAPPVVTASNIDKDTRALDARLQQTQLWSFVKQEFPDWYLERLSGAAKLVAENKSDTDIARHLVEGLVALRRQNAQLALAASGDKLRSVASAFLENLRRLQTHSADACYGFISQGEMSPIVIDLFQRPESSAHIQAQVTSIFQAIAEGRKSPVTHNKPEKSDYNALVEELSKLGWTDNDLQIFSNPRALAQLSHERICKMVQDWFSAHLTVNDKNAQERLLIETLRPVISG